MERITNLIENFYIMAICSFARLRNSERGDTNFVSMLLIIAVVVVLAGAFLAFGGNALDALKTRVINFINNPS